MSSKKRTAPTELPVAPGSRSGAADGSGKTCVIGCVSPVGILVCASSQCVRAATAIVHSSRGESVS